MINLRLITAADLAAVVKLQDSCYSDALYESPALLTQRLTVAANSCWLAENSAGELLAYLFSYPAADGYVTPLAAPFAPSITPAFLYLHDMAVSPGARGLGLAGQLLQVAKQYALSLGVSKLALVAVQGSVPYWQRQGFTLVNNVTAEAESALASYQGQQACYMQLDLVKETESTAE